MSGVGLSYGKKTSYPLMAACVEGAVYLNSSFARALYVGLNVKLSVSLFFTQQKRKLRIYISNTYTPSKPEGEESEKVSSWELRVEGKLLEEVSGQRSWETLTSLCLGDFSVCSDSQ